MSGNAIDLTYDILYEMVRNEKKKTELQKIETNIYAQIIEYLKQKKEIIKSNLADPSLSETEKEKFRAEFKNVRRLVIDFFNSRESKIVNMALNFSRSKSKFDDSALLTEEKMIYKRIMNTISVFRENILLNVVNAKLPDSGGLSRALEISGSREGVEYSDKKPDAQEGILPREMLQKVRIRFLEGFQAFYGPNLEVFGPYDESDTAEVPKIIADILLSKGKAEKLG
ncbi:MAG: hypothetical protein KKF44_00285 [Nanoarchaeota archaeon]|nr:hypothetical protein [Nanoarchaeota archaeon]